MEQSFFENYYIINVQRIILFDQCLLAWLCSAFFFGLYQSSIIDFKLWLVRYFYFFILSAATIKTVNDSFICGRQLPFLGNLLGMLSTHIAWLIPIVVALVGFGGRFFFEVYDISKPGAFFGVMVTAMGASTSIPLAKIPFMSGCMLLGIGFSILFALVLHFTEKEISAPLAKRSLRERIYRHPEAPLDSIYYSFVLFLLYISAKVYIYRIRIGQSFPVHPFYKETIYVRLSSEIFSEFLAQRLDWLFPLFCLIQL